MYRRKLGCFTGDLVLVGVRYRAGWDCYTGDSMGRLWIRCFHGYGEETMKWGERTVDFRTALWVAFWLYVLQVGDPNLLDAVISWIGRI